LALGRLRHGFGVAVLEHSSFLGAVARQRLSQGSVIGHPLACRQHAQQFQRRRLTSPLRAVA